MKPSKQQAAQELYGSAITFAVLAVCLALVVFGLHSIGYVPFFTPRTIA